MISKIESAFPKAKGDIDLAQSDAARAKSKKGNPAGSTTEVDSSKDADESTQTVPVHIRHLGRKLDLIA